GAGNGLLEEVPRDVVGRQVTLAVQGVAETVLVLEAEDPALHLGCRGISRYGLMLRSERHALQPAVPLGRHPVTGRLSRDTAARIDPLLVSLPPCTVLAIATYAMRPELTRPERRVPILPTGQHPGTTT